MKKRHVALAVGLALTVSVGAISLAACDEPAREPSPFEDDSKFAAVATTETTHFLAGKLACYGGDNWGTSDDLSSNAKLRFMKHTEQENLYKITVNLLEDDKFKIRYEGEGWGDGASHSNIPANYLIAEQRDLTDGDIIGIADMGGKAFSVQRDGQYEIWLKMNALNGEPQSVQYVWKKAVPADEMPTAVVSDVRIKGAYNSWNETTLCAAGFCNGETSTTKTFKLKYTGADAAEFGFYTTQTGVDVQNAWAKDKIKLPADATGITYTEGDDNWKISEGVYEISITVDSIGRIKALTITAGATEDANTIVIPPVAPPPAAE